MPEFEIFINVMEPFNPREDGYGNVGQIVTPKAPYKYSWLADYTLEVRDLLAVVDTYVRNGVPFLPVYVLDHSCIRVSTKTFNDPWDESHIGYILGDQRAYLKEIGGQRMSARRHADLRERLAQEVEEYDTYLNVTYFEAEIYLENGDYVTSESWFESEEDAQNWASDEIARLEALG